MASDIDCAAALGFGVDLAHEPRPPFSAQRKQYPGRISHSPFTRPVDRPTNRREAGTSILVAEDNPDSRDALRALLEAYGFAVVEAEDGQEAVRKALRFKPDLVLMDIMMPVMDGLQATRTLRASPDFRQVPIVALTAMAGARQLAMDAGCDGHLPKPIDIPVFLKTIRDLLGRNGEGSSAGSRRTRRSDETTS